MINTPQNVDAQTLEQVIKLFCVEMDLSSVEPEDDFFDLGGDSLMAEDLVTAICQKFEKSFNVSIILDCPTPLAFAQYLSRGMVPGEYIVPVADSTGAEALLIVHGAHGDNYHLRLIGDEMKSRWNIIGVRAKGILQGETPHDSLAELIDDYLKAVKDHVGAYPKSIFGNCAGGILALQVAKQIFDETGQRTNIIMVDPPATFSHYHQDGKNYRRPLAMKAKLLIYRASRDILTIFGLGNTKLARLLRNKLVFYSLLLLMRQVYPNAFPCNLLMFVGDQLMDKSVPGFQSWANEDVLLRILPLPGLHNRMHDLNHDVIDKEIIEFIDEMNAVELQAQS